MELHHGHDRIGVFVNGVTAVRMRVGGGIFSKVTHEEFTDRRVDVAGSSICLGGLDGSWEEGTWGDPVVGCLGGSRGGRFRGGHDSVQESQ